MTSRVDRPASARAQDVRYMRGFIHRLAQALITASHAQIMMVGGLVSEAQEGQYWLHWPEGTYKTFGEWTWDVLHMRASKARSLAKIQRHLGAMNLSEPTLARALRIGWCKLEQLIKVVNSEMGMIQWLDRVESHKLDFNELCDDIRQVKGEPSARQSAEDAQPQDPTAGTAPPQGRPNCRVRKSMVFKMPEDRETLRVWDLALKQVRARTDTELGDAKCAGLVATHYLANIPHLTQGGVAVEVEYLLRAIEGNYGVPAVVANESGLLHQARELLRAWGADQHTDERVIQLLARIDCALNAGAPPPNGADRS